MKNLIIVLTVVVLGTVGAVAQSKPQASLTADKPAITELSCRNTASTLSKLVVWKNDPVYFPGLPVMILAQTTSELTDCLGKFEWSKDDTARILALNILVLTD